MRYIIRKVYIYAAWNKLLENFIPGSGRPEPCSAQSNPNPTYPILTKTSTPPHSALTMKLKFNSTPAVPHSQHTQKGREGTRKRSSGVVNS